MSQNDKTNSTQDQLKEILDCLKAEVNETRNAALEVLLGFTTTAENRLMFKGTTVMKDLLEVMCLEVRDLEEEKTLGKCLNCLINFANEAYWIEKLAEEEVARKVFAVLKEKVKPDTPEIVAPIKVMETAPVTYEVAREGGTI